MVEFHPYGLCVTVSLLLALLAGLVAAGLSFRRLGPLGGVGLLVLLAGLCAGADPVAMVLQRTFEADDYLRALEVRSVGVLLTEALGLGLLAIGLTRPPAWG